MKIQARLNGAVAPLALSLMLAAQPAFAQDDPETPIVLDGPDQAQVEAAGDETIFVTGSRIRRTEFNNPDPIAIIDPDLAQAQGQFSTADMLQSSPIASGSAQITSVISSAFVTNGGVGAETISLRGLGANRTLVLLNGRRAGPAGTRGGVSAFDLNVLPQTIVERIEILKTGASSVYGSDAVAGVVNVITKRDTDGIELDAFVSRPFEGGGEEYRLSGTWGKDFGNGHLLASVDFTRYDLLQRKDRDYLGCPEEYLFTESGARADIIDPRTGAPRCNDTLWGHVWTYDYAFRQSGLYQADYGDNLAQYIGRNLTTGQPGNASVSGFPGFPAPPGSPAGTRVPVPWNTLLGPYAALGAPADFFRVSHTGTYPLTQDQTAAALSVQNTYHPFMGNETLRPQVERYTAYVDGAYNVSDNLEIGAELIFNKRRTETKSYRQFYYLTGYTNDFLGVDGSSAAGVQYDPYLTGDPFSPGWTGSYYVSPTAITDHYNSTIEVDYYRALGWLNGSFGGALDGWGYSGYAQFSRSDGTYTTDIIYADAVDWHDFRTRSCVGETFASGQPCVDINWLTPDFLRGNLTQAERNFLFGVDVGTTQYDQTVGELSFSGPLFALPAGTVQVAFGVAGRIDKINDTPGEQTRAGNSWGLTAAGITAGDSKTWEIFGEAEVPLLKDLPLIESFTVSGSGRMTNVTATRESDGLSDTTNGNWTYSVGANWEVTDWLQFRARYGTSFRAPALFELFLADQTSFLSQREVDPCIGLDAALASGAVSQRVYDNCRAGIPGIQPAMPGDHSGAGVGAEIFTGGGIGLLEPETSTAKTASVIFKPKFAFLPNTTLNVAVDYFDIEIEGEIATLGGAQILSGCYNSEFFPDEPLCSLFSRYPANSSGQNNVETIRASFLNVNRQRNEGIDVTVDLKQDLAQLGSLQLIAQMNWQFRDEIELFEGNTADDNGEVGEPKWVGDFALVWRSPDDSLRLTYGLDVIGESNNIQDYVDINGSLCRTFRGYNVVNGAAQPVCVDVTAEMKAYHSLSVQKEFEEGFTLTAGLANVFDTKPPRVTIQGSNNVNSGVISTVGQAPYASQYDYFGRRLFLNAKMRF